MIKVNTHEIYKIEIDRIAACDGKKIQINPLTITKQEALLNGEIIRIQENQLTHIIMLYFREQGIDNIDMTKIIINIHVATELQTKGEKMYAELAKNGFDCNGYHYVRLASGSGQIRRNTITFIRSDLYEPITISLLCGLSFDDFGNDFNSAKFNAYFGLNLSGCHLLPVDLAPNVCVVDDYEAIRPHDMVNYVTERDVDYITLPDGDYILSLDDANFDIDGDKAIRLSDGVVFTIRHGIKKDIAVMPYDEIDNSPCLNSFDGQGLMCPEWAIKISDYLELGYVASEVIIRAPWVKGMIATVDFRKWFRENGITEIKDSFGIIRKVDTLDVIISKSQFKMHKVYQAKCSDGGVSAWDYLVDCMRANNLLWGIVKPNKPDDFEKALNYQYLEALDIGSEDVEKLCQRTIDYFKRLNSGDIEEIYKNLIGLTNPYDDDTDYTSRNARSVPRFQEAIEENPDFVNDTYIRALILQECQNKLNAAKLGKIIVRGNYQFCISDPIAQLQWIAKNHGEMDIDVVGVVPAGCVYSNYWRNAEDNNGIITLLRSPLIDRNEIAKRIVIECHERYFDYLCSGVVLSIHDLTALGCGGCDFDGDILFTTNDTIIAKGSMDYGVARPLYYELGATGIVGTISNDNLAQADIRGLNSKVGQISNKAASLYAMLEDYPKGSSDYCKIYDSIIALGQIVGMEIDRIKTGIKPTLPLEWKPLQVVWRKSNNPYGKDVMITSEQDASGIYRHNDFVPDVKPYFLKYNYPYLDKDIKQLRFVYNRCSVINFGIKIDELINLCQSGKATEEMQALYRDYCKMYPVNDADCIVNHISHLMERIDFDLHKQVNGGRNMFREIVGKKALDADKLDTVKRAYDGYVRFLREETRYNNSANKQGKNDIGRASSDRLGAIRRHYKKVLFDICGRYTEAFIYLATVAKDNEKNVWDILGNDVVILSIGRLIR